LRRRTKTEALLDGSRIRFGGVQASEDRRVVVPCIVIIIIIINLFITPEGSTT